MDTSVLADMTASMLHQAHFVRASVRIGVKVLACDSLLLMATEQVPRKMRHLITFERFLPPKLQH
eukprot:4024211-Amphidinium_carterae.1